VLDRGALGDDQAHASSGAAAVVLDHTGMGDATGAERTGHGRHDDTGRQLERAEGEGLEQGIGGHGRFRLGEEMRLRLGAVVS